MAEELCDRRVLPLIEGMDGGDGREHPEDYTEANRSNADRERMRLPMVLEEVPRLYDAEQRSKAQHVRRDGGRTVLEREVSQGFQELRSH